MPGHITFLVAFIFFILIINVVFLIIRVSKNRSPYGRRGKKAPSEEMVRIRSETKAYRRIEVEQDRIKKYLDLRNRTWELYEEVRRKYKTTDS